MLAGLSQRPGAQHLLAILPGVSVSKRRVILIELLPPTCLDSPGGMLNCHVTEHIDPADLSAR